MRKPTEFWPTVVRWMAQRYPERDVWHLAPHPEQPELEAALTAWAKDTLLWHMQFSGPAVG